MTKANIFFPDVMSQQNVHQPQFSQVVLRLVFLDISRNLGEFDASMRHHKDH